MIGKAEAIVHGAATIVNAIATGQGAAVSVDLWTQATVEITDEPGNIEGKIASHPLESTRLIEKTVDRVLRFLNLERTFGARVDVRSNIPIGKGLKSSSAAGNAIALASVAALGEALDDLSIINIGIDAAFDAKVTVTGAFDDACASYFGGLVVTNNSKRRILRRLVLDDDFRVLFHVPATKIYTRNSNISRMRKAAPLVAVAFQKAMKEEYWAAMALNGLIYSSALGFDPSVALDALMNGAIAAGLSGTGPAVAAVVAKDNVDSVKGSWQKYEGRILKAKINHQKASVVGDLN